MPIGIYIVYRVSLVRPVLDGVTLIGPLTRDQPFRMWQATESTKPYRSCRELIACDDQNYRPIGL